MATGKTRAGGKSPASGQPAEPLGPVDTGELRHTASLAAGGYRPGAKGLTDLGVLLVAAADEIDALRSSTEGALLLDEAGVELFKDQVLLVLADYQSTRGDALGFSRNEGIRLEVAKRLLDNLRAVAGQRRAAGGAR
jgi:hypothetical protein